MNRYYADVAARAGHRCEYCHAPEAIFNFPFEVEHIIPPSQGGTEAMDNLALACRSCNLHKSDILSARDPEGADDVRLFSPRQDEWNEHFSVEAELGMILGRTSTGRATISSLRINANTQVAARQQWMRLGLFP